MPLALLVDRREFRGRPLRVSRYLQSEEAIERKKERDAAINGRRKGKKEVQRKRRAGAEKEKKEKGEEKKEKKEKKEKETKKEKKEKQQPVEKKEKEKEKKELPKKKEKTKQGENTNSIDLSFMGAKAKLNTHVLKSQKKLLKKGKK